MYKEYFFLTSSPFLNTPDPFFLFDSRSHKETLASMAYGVLEGKGFVLVTGDVGSGKTLLLQSLKRELSGHVLIEIANPWATPIEVLSAVQSAVGLDNLEGEALWDALKQKLITLAAEGRRVVLLIDEAQQLPERTLEGLCLLSNLETATQKLIQIVLVGQSELASTLNKHSLRHLYQRITLRACLQRLSAEETTLYVRHRLRIAGGSPLLFPPECIDLIYRESLGTPRVINNLCDKCLLFAFGSNSEQVTLQIAKDAINSQWPELNGLPLFDTLAPEVSPQPVPAKPKEAPVNPPQPVPEYQRQPEKQVPSPVPSFMTVSSTSPSASAHESSPIFELPFAREAGKGSGGQATEVVRKGLGFRHLFLALLLGIVLGVLVLWNNQGQSSGGFQPMRKLFQTAGVESASQAPPAHGPTHSITQSATPVQPMSQSDEGAKPNMGAQPTPATAGIQPEAREQVQSPVIRQEAVMNALPAATAPPLPGAAPNPLKSREEKVTAKNTVSVLATRHYGAWNETVLDLFAVANPDLSSFDNLPPGTKLQFPIFTRESLVVKDGQGRFFVYFGTFDKVEFARMNLDAIKRSFTGAELVAVERQGVQMHRLFVGPFISLSEAQAVANSLWFKYLPILN